jgi:hypothetical protein
VMPKGSAIGSKTNQPCIQANHWPVNICLVELQRLAAPWFDRLWGLFI